VNRGREHRNEKIRSEDATDSDCSRAVSFFREGEAGMVKRCCFELKLGFPRMPIFGALLAMDRKEPTQEPCHGSCIRPRLGGPIIV